MEKIYRVRPINERTLEELTTPYLWFSKREGFDDICDANISAFIENNPIVIDALKQVFSDEQIERFKKLSQNYGICCFTKELPSKTALRNFPNGRRGICVEYNKALLEDYFRGRNPIIIKDGFMPVIYFSTGATLMICDGTHYLDYCRDGLYRFTSIKEISRHPRNMDSFIFTLLSTISSKFKKQKEERLIIGSINFCSLDLSDVGYKITIPCEAINAVYTYGNEDPSFHEQLTNIGIPVRNYKEANL